MPDSPDTRSRSPMRPSGCLVGSCGASVWQPWLRRLKMVYGYCTSLFIGTPQTGLWGPRHFFESGSLIELEDTPMRKLMKRQLFGIAE